ncbi:MAG TPA: T9SS type A sorting domain-containing protein, partial [Cytophagaceae bacterium]|nr:T9SS type A sorting domain-containing protein [Cytophagaceae bacterium]
ANYYDYLNPFYPNFYYQVASFPMDSTITIAHFTNVLDNAINAGGWFIPMYHSIETGTLMTVSANMFTKQMDSIHSRDSKIWIAPFGEQLRYHKERRYAHLSVESEDEKTWELDFSDNLPDSAFYQPLTIRLKKPSWKISSIVQNNVTISFLDDGDTIQFNAIPSDLEDVIIYKASAVTALFKSAPCSGSCVVLDQNYPNPSEDYTIISYGIENPTHVKLEIYNSDNLSLTTIKNEYQGPGKYEIKFNTQSLPGGIYLYRLTTDAYSEVKRMVVLK